MDQLKELGYSCAYADNWIFLFNVHYLKTIFVCHIYWSVQKHGQAEVLGMTSPNKVVHMQDLSLVWLLQQASMLLADDIVNDIYKVMYTQQ